MADGVVNTGVKNRVDQAEYVKIGDAYELMGTGFKEANEEPGAQVADKKYINMKSKSKSISGYEWVKTFSADQILSEAVIKDFVEIGQTQKIGQAAERDFVTVHLDEPVTGKENNFRARHVRVAVEVSSFPDNDGEMGVEGNLNGIGDIEEGTFDTTTKTFTPAGSAVVGA
ncbi:hypothetical protein NIA71_08120 [Ihubacter massiliensis]|uniref:hypothetical protein n=1 Tax=Ihubacter massiliensis TaxID=1852367 RepID=UPI0011DC81BC|nr:hypothetical protein [Ihubacter massiliensis]MCO7121915.1 hypothetical protein [Ihubacter massiliensis]